MDAHSLSQNPLFAYLHAEGLLNELEVRDLIRKASTERMPLGQILVRHKVITIQELMKALTIQDDDPSAKLGELCVEKGFCDADQIDAALALQARSAPDSLYILLSEFGTSNVDLLKSISRYMSGLERKLASAVGEIADLREKIHGGQASEDQQDAA